MKKTLSTLLAFALAAASPGLAPYQAMAQLRPMAGTTMGTGAVPAPFGAGTLGLDPGAEDLGAAGTFGDAANFQTLPLGSIGAVESEPVLIGVSGGRLSASGAPGAASPASGRLSASGAPGAASPLRGASGTAAGRRPEGPASPASGRLSAAGAPGAASPASGRDRAGKAVAEALKVKVPDFGAMAEGESRPAVASDFLRRLSLPGSAALEGREPVGTPQEGWGSMGTLPALQAHSTKKGKTSKRMPDQDPEPSGKDPDGSSSRSDGDSFKGFMEGEGFRQTPGGPDDVWDGEGGRKGGSTLFSMPGPVLNLSGKKLAIVAGVGAALLLGTQLAMGAPPGMVLQAMLGAGIAWLTVLLPSFALHEWAHAKAANKLGDRSLEVTSRLTLNPFKHIDPLGTVILPMLMLFMPGASWVFGWAKPVTPDPYSFKKPVRDMALAAFAGPAMNLALALAGAGLYRLTSPFLGAYGIIPTLFGLMVDINLVLLLFNLIPLPPFDGHHVVRPVPVLGRLVDRVPARLAAWGVFLAFMFTPLGGLFMGVVGSLHHLLVAAPIMGAGANLAGAWAPGFFALGLAFGGRAHRDGRADPKEASPGPGGQAPDRDSSQGPVDLLVEAPAGKAFSQDILLSMMDVSRPRAADAYHYARKDLLRELEQAGLKEELLSRHGASPMNLFSRISTVSVRVPGDKAQAFTAEVRALGFTVHGIERIELPRPVEPDTPRPERKVVNLEELSKLIKADGVQKTVEDKYGPASLYSLTGVSGWLARTILRLAGAKNPAVPLAVIDSGADLSHPALKPKVKRVVNVTSGENVDDIGHGTHVTGTVVGVDRLQKDVTVYKAFEGGSASNEDILKALTLAANDGNVILSNSWGDGRGDPNAPISKMVRKLAEEGRILIFAAGNAGPGRNTVGAPAIVTYVSPETLAPRVIAVAAADYRKLLASFSSRGPGSRATSGDPSYPNRPDLTAMGVDLLAPWPEALGSSERAISGTSMATPNVAGAVSLLARAYGVTAVGKALDAIAKETVARTQAMGKEYGEHEAGKGFLDVDAAYKALEAAGLAAGASSGMGPSTKVVMGLLRIFGQAPGSAPELKASSDPGDAARRAERMKRASAVLEGAGILLLLAAAGLFVYWLVTAFAQAVAANGPWIFGGLGAVPLFAGMMGVPVRLPNPGRHYPDALKAAGEAVQGREGLRFVKADGSMGTRTLAWHFEFRLSASGAGREDMVLVSYRYDGLGGYQRTERVYRDLAAGSDASPFHLKSFEPYYFGRGSELGPDAALASAQRAFPGFSASSVSLGWFEEPVSGDTDLSYRFYSDDGAVVRVNARTGEAIEVAPRPPGPGAWNPAPGRRSIGSVLRVWWKGLGL